MAPMRALLFALCLAAGTANAGETGITLRPLLGLSGSVSDSGLGLGAQLGVRISPLLLRVALDLGGSAGSRGYYFSSARAGWLFPLEGEDAAFMAGVGVGHMTYGFILDSPTAQAAALIPEVGLLLGENRWLGRALVGVAAFIPVTTPRQTRGFAGDGIAPPHLMGTLVLSL